ncbi:DNA-binding domain-containing protein [Marinomonas flavescens]|uniref:HvfC/BufC N-terminal domain-containing protein n=1 Tax=Marinomonas flavescens TaxID=2529379 RepID=UPI0010560135|nr:DNA-binding domain-containing protein [Marinomonas flavescens]
MNNEFKAALLTDDTRFYREIDAQTMQEKEIRLNVYRNNVVVSLIDALADIFPVTQALVGDDFFRAMAKQYLLVSPPESPIISEYGHFFSDFIRQFDPAKTLPFLADLAALEYNLLTLTNDAEYRTLDHEEVATAFAQAEDPSELYLSLPPTTQLLTSPFAIGSLYQAHRNDGRLRLNQVAINECEYLLIAKSHLIAQLHVISYEEARFFKQLLQNKSLEEALPDSNDFDLGATLAKLIEWKLISYIAVQPIKAE